jgi:hypothetical protein
MILTKQCETVIPNAVYVPSILIATSIMDGRMVVSCQITMGTIHIDDKGKCQSLNQTASILINDLSQLEPDIEKLQNQVVAFQATLMDILEEINKARKVL